MSIDRARLEPAFRDYVAGYSTEGEAISLESSLHLLDELAARPLERIVDLGSGWSSYVFRLFKKIAAPALEVWSIDDTEARLGTTARFLARHDLDTSNLRLWPRLGDRPFDLVCYDMGRPCDRHEHLDRVIETTAGVLICDDMHVEDYRRRVEAFARGQGRRLELLRDETLDASGRFAGRIRG